MTPEDFNPDYLIPGTRIGVYVVRAMLGQGGSSSVYEVESAEGHRFALKLCRYHGGAAYGTTEWRVDQRYSRSVVCLQLLKGLRNVAELYAHDRHPDPLHGYQYLVQELVPGGLFITEWVKRETPTLRKVVSAFVELAELCGAMAGKGICHRDLKPANILVTPDGTPKVIDFESATAPNAKPVTQREASAVPGTGGWQSPELCQAILEEQSNKKSKEPFDFLPWGDLFSLGVVFFECLTGEHPFDTTLPEDMLLAEVAFEKPFHPAQLSTAVPLGLDKVVTRLLEKQPEARYRDGTEVADDLQKLLEKVKDERWDKPLQLPAPDEEDAPVLPLVSVLVPPDALDSASEEQSEVSMPDTPSSSEPGPKLRLVPAADSGANAEPTRKDTSSPHAPDTNAVLPDEADTVPPRGLLAEAGLDSGALDSEGDFDIPRVLDGGPAGSYTVERRLGRGGMGEVYLARQTGAKGFSQLVAIKRLRPGGKQWEARSFADEARVLSLLHHENIARVYSFFELGGAPYLVMEYVEGHSLYTLMHAARLKGYRFPETVACAIAAELAEALDYAHHATDEGRPLRIVHRDVSTTNILISKTGRVVLLDFGVAFFERDGRAVTKTGATFIKGKAPYLSPEQVKHLPLDGRSDLFSVGTVLAEMLTGYAPFGWTADFLTFRKIETVTPEYVASVLPNVSAPLVALCQKLLAAHPDQRFATAREAAMALRQCAGLGAGPEGIQAEVEWLQAHPDAKAPPPAAEAAARAPSGAAVALRHCAGPGAGPEGIRAEVERLQAHPDAKAPPPPAAEVEAAARALSGVKRIRRAVTLGGGMLLATLALLSWYAPRHLAPRVPRPASAVAVAPTPPETSIAPGPPLSSPTGDLVCRAKAEDSGTLATRPVGRHNATVASSPSPSAPAERSAPVVAYQKGRVPLARPAPSERATDGVAPLSAGADESESTVRDQLVVAQNASVQTVASGATEPTAHAAPVASAPAALANHRSGGKWGELEEQLKAVRARLAKVEEEATMPDHAVAALLMSDRPKLAPLVLVSRRHADRGNRKAKIEVFASRVEGESMVAVIVNMKNPRDEVTWEPKEAQVKVEPQAPRHWGEAARWGPPIPAAVRSIPARIVPGQPGRIAVVFDKNDVGLDTGPVVVELLREGKWEFDFTLQPSDLVAMSNTGGP